MKKRILIYVGIVLAGAAQAFAQQTGKQVDSLMKRMIQTHESDTVTVPDISIPEFYNYNFQHKARLDSLQRTVPLPYNEYVHRFIEIYSKRKDMMGRMLGLSRYYFPIFEKALVSYQIPAEIKYLPVIESAMNPHAISRVGATGLWQFMFGTAKGYGLNMDNFVDERKDPIQASYAAAAYFRDAYDELGDWLLAIAAYNCGKGNVTRAMDKAGSRDFWEIRPFLPKETRDYVPAFIASLYVMKSADVHGIALKASSLDMRTDTVHVNNFVKLDDVAEAIQVEGEVLFSLNPSYKKKIVNGTELSPKRLILPFVNKEHYARLYQVLSTDLEMDKSVFLAKTDDVRELRKLNVASSAKTVTSYHKVAPGQNLSTIANRYGVEVQDLKVWNQLKSSTIVPGQRLKIQGKERSTQSKAAAPRLLTYKVKQGDTLSGIAEQFEGVTVSHLKKENGLKSAVIKPGMILKINKG